MSPRALLVALCTCAGVALCASFTLFAGDLNPPVGPVVPTMKDLDTVEPRIPINATNTPGDANSMFRIAQPGSYYLTGDVTGAAGMHGIEIGASNVTINLMGFALRGVPGSLNGISVDGIQRNMTVRDGIVTMWGDSGVDLGQSSTSLASLIEGIQADSNGLIGLRCTRLGVIRECTATSNFSAGIYGLEGSLIEGCTARLNNFDGIGAEAGGQISNCVSRGNTGDGISTFSGCVVVNCVASGNGLNGFNLTAATTASFCTAYANASSGFDATLGSKISDCNASGNTGSGIVVGSDCTVFQNACDGNGLGAGDGAGILAAGSDSRIEANNCTDNDRGIDVNGAGNIIIRNTCAGNTTNWDIVANNVVGPILDRTAPGSAAINGNSAPDSTGSTHPNANFTY